MDFPLIDYACLSSTCRDFFLVGRHFPKGISNAFDNDEIERTYQLIINMSILSQEGMLSGSTLLTTGVYLIFRAIPLILHVFLSQVPPARQTRWT